jgi:hypothetical protein
MPLNISSSENASATEPPSLLAVFDADDEAQLTRFEHELASRAPRYYRHSDASVD